MCLVLGCHCKRASSAQDVTFLLTHKRDPDHSACARGASNWDCRISEKNVLWSVASHYVSENFATAICFFVWVLRFRCMFLGSLIFCICVSDSCGGSLYAPTIFDAWLWYFMGFDEWLAWLRPQQEQLEAIWQPMVDMSPRRRHRRDVVIATMAIVYRHCRWRISVLHVLNILYVFLKHLCFE